MMETLKDKIEQETKNLGNFLYSQTGRINIKMFLLSKAIWI